MWRISPNIEVVGGTFRKVRPEVPFSILQMRVRGEAQRPCEEPPRRALKGRQGPVD